MSDDSTPLATAKTFLAGLKARNIASMRSICQPGGIACLIRDGQPRYLLVVDILDRLIDSNAQRVMDEVSYDEVEHADGDFATVWTPFRFFLDGNLAHTGTNIFNLWKCPKRGSTIIAVQDIN